MTLTSDHQIRVPGGIGTCIDQEDPPMLSKVVTPDGTVIIDE